MKTLLVFSLLVGLVVCQSNLIASEMEFSQVGGVYLQGTPGVTSFNDSMYLFGGSDVVVARADLQPAFAFNTIKSLATPLIGSCAVAIETGEIFIIGGDSVENGTGTTEVRRLTTDLNFVTMAPMATARQYHRCAYDYDLGRIYVAGGYVSTTSTIITTMEYYTIIDNTWTTTANQLPYPRTNFGLAYAASKLYLLGGKDLNGMEVDTIARFNVGNEVWTTASTSLVSPVSGFGTLYDPMSDTILMLGGPDGTCQYMDILNPSLATFAINCSTTAALQLAADNSFIMSIGPNVYVYAGENGIVTRANCALLGACPGGCELTTGECAGGNPMPQPPVTAPLSAPVSAPVSSPTSPPVTPVSPPVPSVPFSGCGQCALDTPYCISERSACVGNRVVPILTCVSHQESGVDIAHFTYESRAANALTIASGSPGNKVLPTGTPNSEFLPGRTIFYPLASFTHTYAANTIVEWFVDGYSLTFNSSDESLRCPRMVSFGVQVSPAPANQTAFLEQALAVFAAAMNLDAQQISAQFQTNRKRQGDLEAELVMIVEPSTDVNAPTPAESVALFIGNQTSVEQVKVEIPAVKEVTGKTLPTELSGKIVLSDESSDPISESRAPIIAVLAVGSFGQLPDSIPDFTSAGSVTIPSSGAGFATYNDMAYFVGGPTTGDVVTVELNPSVQQGSTALFYTTVEGSCVVTTAGGYYVIGGGLGDGYGSSDVYFVSGSSPQALAPMNEARQNHKCVYDAPTDRIYVVGGFLPATETFSSTIEYYSISGNNWTTVISTLSSERRGFTLVNGQNGFLYAIGGENEIAVILDSIEAFDMDTELWTTLSTPLNSPQKYMGSLYVESLSAVFLLGGDTGNCQKINWTSPIDLQVEAIPCSSATIAIFGESYVVAAGPNIYLIQSTGEVWESPCALPDVCQNGCTNGVCDAEPVAMTPVDPNSPGVIFDGCEMCVGATPFCIPERSVCAGQRITPILQCMGSLESGLRRAYFSYENLSPIDITIIGGTKNNDITPSGVPNSLFTSGRTIFYPLSSFTADYAYGEVVDWFVDGYELIFYSNDGSLECPMSITLGVVVSPIPSDLDAYITQLKVIMAGQMGVGIDQLEAQYMGKKRDLEGEIQVVVGPGQNQNNPNPAEVVTQFINNQTKIQEVQRQAPEVQDITGKPLGNEVNGRVAATPGTPGANAPGTSMGHSIVIDSSSMLLSCVMVLCFFVSNRFNEN